MRVCASSSTARITTSSSFPFPMMNLGSMRSRICTTVSTTATPAVRASSFSSAIRSSTSPWSRRAAFSPT